MTMTVEVSACVRGCGRPIRHQARRLCDPCWSADRQKGRLVPLPSRKCEHCGEEFEPTGPKMRFCSVVCQRANHNERRRKSKPPRHCAECGLEFLPITHRHRFCSGACHARHQAQRRAAARKTGTCALCGARFHLRGEHHKFCVACRDPARRDRVKLNQIARNYGLSPEEYWDLVDGRGEVCPLCKREDPLWNLDHCHDTGAVRGFICNYCNLGLGLFGHSPTVLRLAADHIEKFQ